MPGRVRCHAGLVGPTTRQGIVALRWSMREAANEQCGAALRPLVGLNARLAAYPDTL